MEGTTQALVVEPSDSKDKVPDTEVNTGYSANRMDTETMARAEVKV